MSSESNKHQPPDRRPARTERRERLAQELRANLLKRKALARARRPQCCDTVQEEDPEEAAS